LGGPERWCLPQGAVRAVAVVVVNVLGQYSLQLPAPEDALLHLAISAFDGLHWGT
jgi:hypothetical protein